MLEGVSYGVLERCANSNLIAPTCGSTCFLHTRIDDTYFCCHPRACHHGIGPAVGYHGASEHHVRLTTDMGSSDMGSSDIIVREKCVEVD